MSGPSFEDVVRTVATELGWDGLPDLREFVLTKVPALLTDRNQQVANVAGVEALRVQELEGRLEAEEALGDLTDAVVIAVRELRNPPAHAPPHQLVAYMARIATDLHNAEPTDGPPLPVA